MTYLNSQFPKCTYYLPVLVKVDCVLVVKPSSPFVAVSDDDDPLFKVIYTKYSKHWSYTVAHTIDCVCSEMLNQGLNHGFFLSLFKLTLNFIFEF